MRKGLDVGFGKHWKEELNFTRDVALEISLGKTILVTWVVANICWIRNNRWDATTLVRWTHSCL